MKGTIKMINQAKGFGFITLEGEDKKDLFFHANDCGSSELFNAMQQNDTVTFETGDSPKGPKAVNVVRA